MPRSARLRAGCAATWAVTSQQPDNRVGAIARWRVALVRSGHRIDTLATMAQLAVIAHEMTTEAPPYELPVPPCSSVLLVPQPLSSRAALTPQPLGNGGAGPLLRVAPHLPQAPALLAFSRTRTFAVGVARCTRAVP